MVTIDFDSSEYVCASEHFDHEYEYVDEVHYFVCFSEYVGEVKARIIIRIIVVGQHLLLFRGHNQELVLEFFYYESVCENAFGLNYFLLLMIIIIIKEVR